MVMALASIHPTLRNAPVGVLFKFDEETIRRGLHFTLRTDLGDLDLLSAFYEAVEAHSTVVEFFGRRCRVLSIEGLIKSKKHAGRAKDLAAVQELQALLDLNDKSNSLLKN
ncbi:MAG: hypothetical protein ACRD5F_02610 [Candidatus Acidiferrales bacterium]